jgi:hypothetical protein
VSRREVPSVLALVGLGLVAGVVAGHPRFALVMAVALVIAWRLLGFPGVVAVCFATVAVGSSGYPQIKDAGLDERWVALGTVAAWPLVSQRRLQVPAGRLLLLALCGLIGLAALSALWSIDRRLTVERVGSFVLLLWVALVVVPSHARTASEATALARALAILVVVASALAIGIFVVDPSVGRQTGATHGIRGWFENSNELGIWAAALAPCLLAIRPRRLALAGGLVVLGAIAGSASRGGLGAILLLAIASLPFGWRTRVAIGAAIVLAATAVALSPARDVLRGTALVKHAGSSASPLTRVTGGRNEAWDATFDQLANRPVGGFGFGTGDRVFRLTGADQSFVWFDGNSPNSGYLQILLELGAAGLALLCVVFAAGVRDAWRRAGDPSRQPFLLMAGVMLLIAVTESAVTSAGGPFSLLLWTGLGVAVTTVPVEDLPLTAVARRHARRRLSVGHRAAIALLVLGAIALVAAAPVPRFHDLFRQVVRPHAETPDPLYSAPVDGRALRRAGDLLPDDATYYLQIGRLPGLLPFNVRGAANLFFTPAVQVRDASQAGWVLSYRAPAPIPAGLRAVRTTRLGDGIYLLEVRRS